MSFQATTYGKWILCGEHSVLRGAPALVFPVKSYYLKLSYNPSDKDFTVKMTGPYGKELDLLFWGVLEKSLEKLNRQRSELKGELEIFNSIPIGAGLGASAAFCVAMGRYFEYLGWIGKSDIYEFSRELENLFHGESSGVDIAVNLTGTGIRFLRGGEWAPLKMNWEPQWFLSYCGQRGVTAECVDKVSRIKETDVDRFERADLQMKQACEKAEKALLLDERQGRPLLIEAIQEARNCFEDWGLCGGQLGIHLQELEGQGALAVKPTGSGGGGYALSLWSQSPPESLKEQLLST